MYFKHVPTRHIAHTFWKLSFILTLDAASNSASFRPPLRTACIWFIIFVLRCCDSPSHYRYYCPRHSPPRLWWILNSRHCMNWWEGQFCNFPFILRNPASFVRFYIWLDFPGATFGPIEDNGMSPSIVILIVKISLSVRSAKSVPMLGGSDSVPLNWSSRSVSQFVPSDLLSLAVSFLNFVGWGHGGGKSILYLDSGETGCSNKEFNWHTKLSPTMNETKLLSYIEEKTYRELNKDNHGSQCECNDTHCKSRFTRSIGSSIPTWYFRRSWRTGMSSGGRRSGGRCRNCG